MGNLHFLWGSETRYSCWSAAFEEMRSQYFQTRTRPRLLASPLAPRIRLCCPHSHPRPKQVSASRLRNHADVIGRKNREGRARLNQSSSYFWCGNSTLLPQIGLWVGGTLHGEDDMISTSWILELYYIQHNHHQMSSNTPLTYSSLSLYSFFTSERKCSLLQSSPLAERCFFTVSASTSFTLTTLSSARSTIMSRKCLQKS